MKLGKLQGAYRNGACSPPILQTCPTHLVLHLCIQGHLTAVRVGRPIKVWPKVMGHVSLFVSLEECQEKSGSRQKGPATAIIQQKPSYSSWSLRLSETSDQM